MDKPSTSTDSSNSVLHDAPPEIIITILESLLASSQSQPLGRKYRDLICFTHVSSQLRNIAVTTPTLWTRIEITDKPASFELAKTCLQRSGSQKLDITVCVAARIGSRLPGIIGLVSYAAVRTKRLFLGLAFRKESQWMQIQDALHALASPILDELELKFWYDDSLFDQNGIRTLSPPTRVPSLRSLVLREVVPAVLSPLLGNLKKLVVAWGTCVGWPFARIQDVLDECRQLESLELIANPEPVAGRTVHHAPLPREPTNQTLPKLRLLILKGHSSSLIFHFLLGLKAPELEEVKLGFALDPFSLPSLSTLDPFHSVQLLSISLPQRTPRFPYSQLRLFLPRAFPNIGEIALSRNGWPLLDMFSPTQGGESDASCSALHWNELRGLSLADSDEQCCDGMCMERLSAVKAFLKMRSSKSLPRLKWAQVSTCWPAELNAGFDSTVEAIREMLDEDEGLGLLFTKEAADPCYNTYSER